jgi:SAM-dependent methyltransferase
MGATGAPLTRLGARVCVCVCAAPQLPYDLVPLRGGGASGAGLGPLGSVLAPQWDPLRVAATAAAYMRDQADVARRRAAKGGQEVRDGFSAAPERYPAYYLQNFHYQTEGWLSEGSAELYDYQVETLFLGSADAMRRRALPHIASWMASRSDASSPPPKLLDVASGTGRFLSFVKDNWPEVEATALDLSPFYLRKARETLRASPGPPVTLLEANAERVPLPDASFDAITCVYLFHGAAAPPAGGTHPQKGRTGAGIISFSLRFPPFSRRAARVRAPRLRCGVRPPAAPGRAPLFRGQRAARRRRALRNAGRQ